MIRYKCIHCQKLWEEMDMHEIFYSPAINPTIINGICKICWIKKEDVKYIKGGRRTKVSQNL